MKNKEALVKKIKTLFKRIVSISFMIIFLTVIVFISYLGWSIFTRNESVSISGEVANSMYRIIKPKRFLNYLFENPTRSMEVLSPSDRFKESYETAYYYIDGNELITASLSDSKRHIIYLHGGGYVLGKDGMKHREKILGQLIENTNSKVTFFEYPVAPESNCEKTLQAFNSAYRLLIETYPQDEFIFVGESAGGGLALSYAMQLKEENIKQPTKLILFSPWLDVSMSNPEIDTMESLDMLLSKEALLNTGNLYRGQIDAQNPKVSPIYGDFDNLGKILIFYGSHELFYPDGVKLKKKLKKENSVDFRFYPEMQHVWVLSPIAEANKALEETYSFILEK